MALLFSPAPTPVRDPRETGKDVVFFSPNERGAPFLP